MTLAVSRLERKQTLPTLNPARERLLEYDLARAVARVGASQQPTIGLMSSLLELIAAERQSLEQDPRSRRSS